MSRALMVVLSNPVGEEDDAFNDWYDNRHVIDILDVPGIVSARRFDLAPVDFPVGDGLPTLGPPEHRYLAVYELDRDPQEVMAEFVSRMHTGQLPLSEMLDMSTVSMTTWTERELDAADDGPSSSAHAGMLSRD